MRCTQSGSEAIYGRNQNGGKALRLVHKAHNREPCCKLSTLVHTLVPSAKPSTTHPAQCIRHLQAYRDLTNKAKYVCERFAVKAITKSRETLSRPSQSFPCTYVDSATKSLCCVRGVYFFRFSLNHKMQVHDFFPAATICVQPAH